jgi:hypothetical protein
VARPTWPKVIVAVLVALLSGLVALETNLCIGLVVMIAWAALFSWLFFKDN